jgi:SAM-dependent methyltransferase
MIDKIIPVFERSGLAAVSDLDTTEVKMLLGELVHVQDELLAKEGEFRSAEYKWPRDPLRTWSRVWEYPYVYYHLQRTRSCWGAKDHARVVDLGCGVTFFPFSVARLGYHVTCVDIDPTVERDLIKATSCVSYYPGSISVQRIDGEILPFKDGEFDVAYCVSVLEHISNTDAVVAEIARILKPGGLFLLTIDLAIDPNGDIGVAGYRRLMASIKARFDYGKPDATVHPADILDNTRGQFGKIIVTRPYQILLSIMERIRGRLGMQRRQLPLTYRLAVEGFVLTRKKVITML